MAPVRMTVEDKALQRDADQSLRASLLCLSGTVGQVSCGACFAASSKEDLELKIHVIIK
jgi:hypothetical protein